MEEKDGKIEKKIENWADLQALRRRMAYLDKMMLKKDWETANFVGFLGGEDSILVKKDRKNTLTTK